MWSVKKNHNNNSNKMIIKRKEEIVWICNYPNNDYEDFFVSLEGIEGVIILFFLLKTMNKNYSSKKIFNYIKI